jgi:hypothetical protein
MAVTFNVPNGRQPKKLMSSPHDKMLNIFGMGIWGKGVIFGCKYKSKKWERLFHFIV